MGAAAGGPAVTDDYGIRVRQLSHITEQIKDATAEEETARTHEFYKSLGRVRSFGEMMDGLDGHRFA
jgi:hypothetical protein